MNSPRVTFDEFRECTSGERRIAFDTIAKYFPLHSSPPIDLETPHSQGGSFISNWNLTPTEATIATDVLKALDCDCYFIMPIPSWRGFPSGAQEEGKRLLHHCLDNMGKLKVIMPYFAVHTFGKSAHCAEQFKTLAIAHVMDNETLMKKAEPDIHRISYYATLALLARARKSSQSK